MLMVGDVRVVRRGIHIYTPHTHTHTQLQVVFELTPEDLGMQGSDGSDGSGGKKPTKPKPSW